MEKIRHSSWCAINQKILMPYEEPSLFCTCNPIFNKSLNKTLAKGVAIMFFKFLFIMAFAILLAHVCAGAIG